ncbi:porin family protein [Bacteroides ovatus]|uniref:porin family protein n=1 Tax=Bacteroides ovatus TaxID=28116 RepID=UPI001F1FF6C6|nr:porin family protein [Bacteroides ovatus]MCE8922189.1 PorT family protein [Bacteroides ovatus]
MKKGLIFVLFALVSIVSYSQISWNAKVGMNMSNFTGDMDTDMKIGFNVGVGMEYQFSDMWSIQPSLMLTQKGAKIKEDGETMKFNPMYLEIPVLAAARFAVADNQNIVVKAGPYFAFGVAGKVKVGDDKADFFGDGDDQFGGKRFDCGIGVGVAYEIGKFFVGLDGEFGFTNVVDFKSDEISNPKNMNFSIGVGYKF